MPLHLSENLNLLLCTGAIDDDCTVLYRPAWLGGLSILNHLYSIARLDKQFLWRFAAYTGIENQNIVHAVRPESTSDSTWTASSSKMFGMTSCLVPSNREIALFASLLVQQFTR